MVEYNKQGEEIPDDRPMSAAVGFKRPPSLAEMVKNLVRNEQIQRDFDTHGIETFDDADDFNVDDDFDPSSPWEESFDPTYPHIAARMQEVRSGVVQDKTPAEIAEKIAQMKSELSKLRATKAEREEATKDHALERRESRRKKAAKASKESEEDEDDQ